MAKADGGKFFIMDEQGSASLVIMPVDEYQKLLINKLQKQILDVEEINKEIVKAQLGEVSEPEVKVQTKIFEGPTVTSHPEMFKRATRPGAVDLREEVIDPSFDFEGPKLNIDDL